MSATLASWFSQVCGQHPEHIWAPAMNALCCCQRCTGLYMGALVGLLAHVWWRPRMNGRFLAIHGWFLAAMVPLGFHWVPQGPVTRTVSGFVFALAIVTYLRLPGAVTETGKEGGAKDVRWAAVGYWGFAAMTLALTLELARSTLAGAAWMLDAGIVLGALTLAGLVLRQVVHLARWAGSWLKPGTRLTEPEHA